MARRMLDLPLPEGPTSANTSPGAQASFASRAIGAGCLSSTCSPLSAMIPRPARGGEAGRADGKQRNDQQRCGHDAGGRRMDGLEAVVDGDGDGPGLTRYAASHHEHDAELAQCVGESQHERRDYAWPCQGKLDPPERAPRGQTAAGSGIADIARNRLESALHG